ncbi:MAG: DUF1353 domain-containing protein [Pseudomonadota bacterium]
MYAWTMQAWKWMLLAALLPAVPAVAQQIAPAPPNYGKYLGTLQLQWLPDEQHVLVLAPFDYIDPQGQTWSVARGHVVDASSIPQLARSLMGEPFDEEYREATVIHDVACDEKTADWESVHAAFYTALLASGVDGLKARLLYAAVYHFGPRWDARLESRNVPASQAQSEINKLSSQLSAGKNVKLAIIPKIASSKQNAAEQAARAPRMVDVLVSAPAARRSLNELDFVMLRLAIENREHSRAGPMSLDEIRNFKLGK